jgi:hypothetical protein
VQSVISCLFWNLQGLARAELVAKVCVQYEVNLLMLAECAIDPVEMLTALSNAGLSGFKYPPRPTGIESDLRLFLRHASVTMEDVEDDANDHVTVRHLFGIGADVLLAVVHLPSKRYASTETARLSIGRNLADLIRSIESRFGHKRTVLVGDLNMNPFEAGMVSADALHGVPTRAIAGRESRVVDKKRWDYFYNPMWQFFGERPDGPPGTYYYAGSGQWMSYFWNIFDQVLVRPSMMQVLSGVRVIDRVGSESLLNLRGNPKLSIGSDHLPILFKLDLGEAR